MRDQRLRVFPQPLVVDGLPDQPPRLRLLGGQRLAEHGQAAGARIANQTREMEGAAGVRDQAQPREGENELRRAGRDDDVAGQRDGHPGTRGHAVDGADYRLAHRPQLADQRIVELLDGGAEIGRRPTGSGDAAGQVLAGAETTSASGQQHGAALWILGRLLERRTQFTVHDVVERVQPVRTVEHDGLPTGMPRNLDEVHAPPLEGSGWPPLLSVHRHAAVVTA